MPILTPPRTALRIYVDQAALLLADILTPSGEAITDSVIYTDTNGLLPEFWGPDSAHRVWARIVGTGLETYPLRAQYHERMDKLELDDAVSGQVLVCGEDGVWRPQTLADNRFQWGHSVSFSETEPDAESAPDDAVWVRIGDDMRLYRKGP